MEFNRGVVRPLECYRTAWALIKPRYGLMLGICFVGMLIASAGPFGLLMGPMMCGIFLCYLRLLRGEPVEFNNLFAGFDFFGAGFIVALVQVIPLMLVQIPYVCWIMYLTFTAAMNAPRHGPGSGPGAIYTPLFFISVGADMVIVIAVAGVLQAFFVFGFALVADRKMKGWDAVKLSARAAMGNLGGVLGLMVLNLVLGFAGLLLCYVGAILLIPLTMGVWAVAYRQIFPEPVTGTTV